MSLFSLPFIFKVRPDAINKKQHAIVYITQFSLFSHYSERFLPIITLLVFTVLYILYYVANKCLVAVTVT